MNSRKLQVKNLNRATAGNNSRGKKLIRRKNSVIITPKGGRTNKKRTLIRGGTIVTMNKTRAVLKNQDILVVGNRIAAIDRLDRLDGKVDEVINAKGKIIIPGLIQTHLHLTQTLQRNLVSDQPLEQWLGTTLKLEAAHDWDSNFWSNMLGIAELFQGGTTAIYNMDSSFFTEAGFGTVSPRDMPLLVQIGF
jgi:5-methylthioadenosine/S-adenosylhomocysteine deaminase